MNDGTVLLVYGKHWTDATPGTQSQAYLDDYTEDVEPVWAAVDPTTGSPVYGPWNRSTSVPIDRSYTTRSLHSCCSRRNYLYLLQRLDGKPYLQLINLTERATLQGDEFVPVIKPSTEEIWFDNGCYIQGKHLVLIGEGQTSHSVYLSRKEWSRLGVGSVPWEYKTSKGWSSSASQIEALPFTTIGPSSGAVLRDRTTIATLVEEGGVKKSELWTDSLGGKWTRQGTLLLEVGADAAYAGAGVYLQPHLVPNGDAPEMTSTNNSYAIPYFYTLHLTQDVEIGGDPTTQQQLDNTWALLSVTRKT